LLVHALEGKCGYRRSFRAIHGPKCTEPTPSRQPNYPILGYIPYQDILPPNAVQKTIHSDGQATLRRLLRDTRIAQGLSQVELAKSLKVPQSFVSKVEAGERRLDVIEFIAYSRGVGATPQALLKKLTSQ
jgi:hypothetical protein